MVNVLIVGHGFIGRNLAGLLASENETSVTVLDRSEIQPKLAGVSYLPGDFSSREILKEALREKDLVYHFVSHTIPSSSWDSPQIEIEKNLLPSLQLIELAAEANVKKIAFASSGGTIYGFQQGSLTEESRTEPYSPYGIIKRTIESFLEYIRVKEGVNYDIYRISNVYGEGQNIDKGLGL
ncbi:MAG: NAD-dependent epimerase/dehydratase family protein [Pyrinomonadaceae bacterium]